METITRFADEPDAVFALVVREGDVVEIWQREGRSGGAVAALLRRIADGFERGDVKRVW
jgi:hypothetical protein